MHPYNSVLGPIANMFWLDQELESDVYLDGNFALVFIYLGARIYFIFPQYHT